MMGLLVDDRNRGGRWGFGSLTRRKQVDSVHVKRGTQSHQLARELSAVDLVAIGVGATIGAGVYILVGAVAREHSGPALTISFLIAGIAAGLSAFCYAELACRCPSAGSAYHYSYICLGEGVAWLIGWALMLEYTIGSSAVARGITPSLGLLLGGQDRLPALVARFTIPGLDVMVDPCAAALVIIVTLLLCSGIKESSSAQTVVTMVNVFSLIFIIIAGGYLGFKTGWAGYELPSGYFPFGVNGVIAGSAIVFFSYTGFDSVTSTAEEVKRPQRDLPIGIGVALSICCILYMLVSIVIVGLVPYYSLDPDTPISTAFSSYGVQWAVYIINTGAVTALFSSLMGSILPQPRVLMAMARDGLLPSFFSDINPRTKVPVKGTIANGAFAAGLAFFMDVSQLSGMVSVGTLLAFTTASISVLILRYVPPDEMPIPSSCKESIASVSSQFRAYIHSDIDINIKSPEDGTSEINQIYSTNQDKASIACPLIDKEIVTDGQSEVKRRKVASWSITLVCIGILVLTSATSAQVLPSLLRVTLCGVGAALLLCSMVVLALIDQDKASHSFGHAGGFVCPFVPYLPVASILINTYLLVNFGAGTWVRVSIWLVIGAFVYICYGRTHSLLLDAVFVPTAYANKLYRSQSEDSP